MYDAKDLTFVANMGVLQQPVDKTDWIKHTDQTALFSHNTQTAEAAQVDVYEAFAGFGVGGAFLMYWQAMVMVTRREHLVWRVPLNRLSRK